MEANDSFRPREEGKEEAESKSETAERNEKQVEEKSKEEESPKEEKKERWQHLYVLTHGLNGDRKDFATVANELAKELGRNKIRHQIVSSFLEIKKSLPKRKLSFSVHFGSIIIIFL